MKRLIASMTILPLLCVPAFAQQTAKPDFRSSKQINSDWQVCRDELSRYDFIGLCATNLLKQADNSLNHEYQQLISYLGKDGSETNKHMQTLGYPKITRKNLIKVQRQWIQFREMDCQFSSPLRKEMTYTQSLNNDFLVHDNFLEQADRAVCLLEATLKRLDDLEKMNGFKGHNGSPW